jgi:outer membrane protein
MDFFYGVEPIFETATRSAYRAKSGYLGTGLSVSYKTKITQKIQIGGAVKVGLHNGAANENSPLFTDKSTYSVVVGFVWNFWESAKRESLAN